MKIFFDSFDNQVLKRNLDIVKDNIKQKLTDLGIVVDNVGTRVVILMFTCY